MSRETAVATVIDLLRSSGWEHSYVENRCFDLFARGDRGSLILKVHENVDSADRESAAELKQACRYLGAAPLIVGERTSRGDLEPWVVYERYDIPTVNTATLRQYLRLREPPVVCNTRGGYSVAIDADRFEERRKAEGYSLNALAKEVGVSRRTIDTYRRGGSASVETAQRLEEVLGDVVAAVDFVEVEVEAQPAPDNSIAQRLVKIGFDASGFSQAPFDAAARDEEERFVGSREEELEDALLEFLARLQEIADSRTFLVTDDDSERGDIAAISRDRMKQVDGTEEFKEEIR
ncbi:MAG: helix-turn-helix domain-containing protein [Candidatus Nanohaloarchaea archaeon]|nr:helix-turn-helix domain-containing protein [Candidatus Nanohaloarchaea archaeon]